MVEACSYVQGQNMSGHLTNRSPERGQLPCGKCLLTQGEGLSQLGSISLSTDESRSARCLDPDKTYPPPPKKSILYSQRLHLGNQKYNWNSKFFKYDHNYNCYIYIYIYI